MVLKFGVIHFPSASCVQGKCPQRGYYIDAMDTVCREWHLDCIFELFNSSEYGDVDQNTRVTSVSTTVIEEAMFGNPRDRQCLISVTCPELNVKTRIFDGSTLASIKLQMSSSFQRLVAQETEHGRRIARTLEYNPTLIEPLLPMGVKRMFEVTDQYLVTIGPRETALALTEGNKNYRFYIMELGMGELSTFATRKGSPILPLLNRIASVYRECDLHEATVRMGNYLGSSLRCDLTASRRVTGNVNEIAALTSSLIIYGIGLGGSVIAFVAERVVSRRFRT